MWLPDKLYELLPYLYALAGFYTMFSFDTPIAYGSGFLLLMTAGMVWVMRRDYRHGNTRTRKSR